MRKIIIAIDGYSACGKSSTAKTVAKALNYTYIDTGAMYRAVTYYFMELKFISLTNEKEIQRALGEIDLDFRHNAKTAMNEICLNGVSIEHEIRKMSISEKVSEVSTLKQVRQFLVAQQQKMGKRKGIVMDGRDIGTVVFPQAELKIFMTADSGERAKRRQQELLEQGQLIPLEEVLDNLKKRDFIDSTRTESPLKQAPDAIVVDTTYVTLDEQVEYILQLFNTAIAKQIQCKN
ncbi:MAG: (d)CMP kinase [Thermoflexibacteraceae bacterium]